MRGKTAKEKGAHIVFLPITCMIQSDIPPTFEKKLRKSEKVEKMKKLKMKGEGALLCI